MAENTEEIGLDEQMEELADDLLKEETEVEKSVKIESGEAEDNPAAEEKTEKKGKGSKTKKKKSEEVTIKRTEYEDLKRKCDEYLDLARRSQAEFANFKKRNETLRADSFKEGVAEALRGVFVVKDGIEKAIASMTDEDDPHREGMELILRQFAEYMEKLGVEEINTDGTFDPVYHQAVMQCPKEDGKESGDIALVLQKGYKIGDRVLRFAMVGVTE